MKCTLYEYSLRISGSTNKLEVAGLSLFLPLGISFCSESLDVSNINLAGSDSGNRTLMNFVHYSRNPTLITGDELRCSRTYIFVLREQKCYIALSGLNKAAGKSVVLKRIIIRVDFQRILERSNLAGFCQFKNFLLSCVRQEALVIMLVVVKNIVFHIVISSFRFIIIFFRLFFIRELGHHGEDSRLLFIVHGFKDVFDGLNFLIFFISFSICGTFIFIFLIFLF